MISLCMIVKNEEKYLENCLNSVKNIVDEIIIVDTGSTDKTKEIAGGFGAKVHDFKWEDDFSAARNESLRHASHKWILVLDADEIIDEENARKIRELVKKGDFTGFSFEQRSYLESYFEGAYSNKTDFEPARKYPFYILNRLVRLFRNGLGIQFSHRVHELVEDSMREKKLDIGKTGVIIHHFGSLKERADASSKADFYSKMIIRQAKEHPGNPRYLYQLARMYLGKANFPEALKYFEETAKIDPNYKLVFSEIAKVHLRLRNKNEAISNFRKSMELNPNNPSPANNLAVALMSAGRFDEAKKILEKQVKMHPNNIALKQNYNECLKNQSASIERQ